MRLRVLRERAGLTQERLADEVGVRHPQIHRWETGKQQIPSGRIPELARILRCHPGEIFAELPRDAALARLAEALPEAERRAWIDVGEAMVRLLRRKK